MQYRFNQNILRLLSREYEEGGFSVLLAVSGGVDSMVMSELASNCPYISKVAVAHCNFSLRSEESDGDEALVRRWAESKGMPLFTVRFDTTGYAARKSLSIEMAARELRYDWFERIAAENGYDYVAVAHNLNDNVETFFLNLMRGTGVKGLSGMKELAGRILRPMLGFTREQIEDFAAAAGVPYRTDSTNLSTEYKRNRIRHCLFPVLKELNPSFLRTMTRNMKYISEVSDMADAIISSEAGQISAAGNGGVRIPLTGFSSPSYSVYRLLSGYGFNSSACEDISQVASDSLNPVGKIFYSETHVAVIDRGFVAVYPLDSVPVSLKGRMDLEEAEVSEQQLADNGMATCSFGQLSMSFSVSDRVPESGCLYADADKLCFPLKVREWNRSDRMRPFGMRGTRKLSDIFSDAKLNVVEKSLVPVVEDASGKIVFVSNMRSSDDFRASEKTVRYLSFRIR